MFVIKVGCDKYGIKKHLLSHSDENGLSGNAVFEWKLFDAAYDRHGADNRLVISEDGNKKSDVPHK